MCCDDPASCNLVAADTIPFDWDRPLRHPKRDQWGTVVEWRRGARRGGETTTVVCVKWNNGQRMTCKPLGWFLRRKLGK